MNRILIDVVPTWTNKEVLIAFGSAAAVLIPAFISVNRILFRIFSSALRSRLAVATRDVELRDEEIKRLKEGDSKSKLLLDEAIKQSERLSEENSSLAKLVTHHKELAESDRSTAEKLRGDLEMIQSQLGSERKRVERALKIKGFTWTEKVRYDAPEFRALDDRKMPIISVLNLKGGVGKTTLTANLGAALGRRGWRVLMIDLDLQGSLTSLFMAEQDQTVVEQSEQFIGDFLAKSFDAEFPNLLDFTRPILNPSGSALVGTVDTLAYAETNLTVRWVLREGNRDPRFILRRELHLKRISAKFDIVLLDCPPLINICCVNALAASDSVLIPVMPSKPTTERVPVLLSRMLQFRQNINSHLKVLGLVANRTFGQELTSDEQNRLSELEVKAKNVWGEEVPRLETFIRQSTEVRMAEDNHRPLAEGEKMAEVFDILAREVEGRLPTFCRPAGISTSLKAEVMQ